MEAMECPYCEGQGWTAEHDPNCTGNCEQWGCPIQWGCSQCNGGGFVERQPPPNPDDEAPF